MNRTLIKRAFLATHQGYSANRTIADPDLNKTYLIECRSLGLDASDYQLNKSLLNLRKAGGLTGLPRAKITSFNDDEYRFAVEISIRHLERRDSVSLDDVICEPSLAKEFDQLCADLAPGFRALEYRWCALSLRKKRKLPPEPIAQTVGISKAMRFSRNNLSIEQIPSESGIYAFMTSDVVLYVGEASNLRKRIAKHLDHSDNKMLARWLWENEDESLYLEIQTLPQDTTAKIRRYVETELIQARSPVFNIRQK